MAERLRVIIEFSKNKEKDLLMYQELMKYSNPGATVKEMLCKVTPLPNIDNVTQKE